VSASGEGIGETQVVVLAGLAKLLSTGIVGGMAASGGKELAATLVDRVIRDLDAETETGRENADKKRLNLVVFLAEMYNLQVIAAGLVFDLVKQFISNGLKEANVEALLRILKGGQHRGLAVGPSRNGLTCLSACSVRDAAPARRSYRAQADHPAGPGAAEWYRRKEPEVGRTALTWIWPRAERHFVMYLQLPHAIHD
jgi:hypothetical protein